MAELTAAIILAAGKGTRIKSSIPKVLLPMCGRSLVGHVNDAVVGAGAQHTVFVVRHEREKVAAHIQQINPQALIADQDEIKGTGRAAWCGLQALPEDLGGSVLVIAGDSPMFTAGSLQRLAEVHEEGGNAVTVLSAILDDATGYGRITRDGDGTVTGIVEHADATPEQLKIREVGTSTYIFDIAFLREVLNTLGTDNAQGEVYLTDAIAAAYEAGRGVGSFVLDDGAEASGVNTLIQRAQLRAEKNRRILESWMLQGVSVIDPTTTHIDVDVTLEPDAVVEPGTILRGKTHVAAFAVVGPNSELTNVTVGERARVPHAVASDVEIAPDEQVPPFSVLG
ncbi:bifunctional UDP-N-acetylglucosamine pyrophosphorylase/glucosamine-1-phosphate N-acetyltransferase [Trueperella bonasi]|uniref:Bifunctional UDP-N-acetylglucosamine pyrophosphorylase/glucosamine-1-phosphate N-acetyltransferase n=1 Tax=Trueperella bonasi TaxID=312286 RepID=A0ABT9NFG5_9ACTO|nr:NTP transferase domain-containing protein [Trueperella bonasi]MDP9806132.1 bifunctional UDP-N-acetylglucosamine pyrophosphorylase/glucosamine-1-phosphate N-acetyltransferase [Trueperella bonasi]